jgi:hypothetical protein
MTRDYHFGWPFLKPLSLSLPILITAPHMDQSADPTKNSEWRSINADSDQSLSLSAGFFLSAYTKSTEMSSEK